MRAPEEGTYSPQRIMLCQLKSLRANSAWSNDDPAIRAGEIARGCIEAGRAGPEIEDDLTRMFQDVVSGNPRKVTAKIVQSASMADRLRAVGSLGEEVGRAFADGESADISSSEGLATLKKAIAAQDGMGAISPHLSTGRPVIHASMHMPIGSRALSEPLAKALGDRPGCSVVLERRENGDDRIHYSILLNTIRANLTAAFHAMPEPSIPFVIDPKVGDLHPLAWAVLQATMPHFRMMKMMGPTPVRTRRAGTKLIRTYRDAWQRTAQLNTAIAYQNMNEIERIKGKQLVKELPPAHVLKEILGYFESRYRSSDAYLDYLRKLIGVHRTIPD